MTLLAQGGTGSPPAGGGEMGQVIGGTIGAMIVTAAMFYLVLGHRSGRVKLLNTLGLYSERKSGLPPWCALPLAVLSGALLIAVFGMYWDISTHLDAGRDPGPFANASHYFILVGLFGVFFAGLLAVFLPTEKPGPTGLPLPGGLQAPLGGVLILVCSGIALTGFPLDDVWHRIFGQDVTLWGPTHLLLFGGASMSTLGGMILLMEGATFAREVRPERATRNVRIQQVLLGGAFLIGLSTFQGEFDFAVPQFRLVFHPILLMLASSVALVAVRVWAGPGAALGAAGFFILVRGILTLLVSPLFGHTTLHFPLYLAEAAVVELIALRVRPRQADPARAARRPGDRHRRARRRVGVVARLVDDRVALEHARRGRHLRVRGGRGGRRDRRLHRARPQLARDRSEAGAALRAARRARRARGRGGLRARRSRPATRSRRTSS